ncbi:dienelactone hydrolase family protein [Vibrio cholerae]|nr:dienelactone hydrolase family protein [Vibrio cholerae]EJL6364772.1 dienelactone hydrolase family protein [Vibrio cholerae]
MRFILRLFVVQLITTSTFSNAYEVGFNKANVPSSIETNGFPMVVFYPTSSEPKMIELGPFKLNVAVEGEVLKGKYPLVIVSHGSGGSNLSYKDIAISLARSGFIVGMPLHPQNNYMDNTLEGSVTNYTNRPKHITLAIDRLLNTSGLNTHIDSDKIAVLGHSVGGYTALAVAGGVGDTSSMTEICKNSPLLTDPYCAPVRTGSVAKTIIRSTKDPRVKAIIIMAPVGILFSTEGSLNDVDIPVLLLKAEKDKEVTEPYNADAIEKGLPNKNKITSIMISNAGHYSFLTTFPDFIKPELGLIAEDPNGFNRVEFQEKLGTIIVDYLKRVLK